METDNSARSKQSDREWLEIMRDFNFRCMQGLQSDFFFRIALFALIGAGSVFGLALATHTASRVFGVLWLSIACLWLVSFLYIFWVRAAFNLYPILCLNTCLALSWWVSLPVLGIPFTWVSFLVFVLIMLNYSLLPWRPREGILIGYWVVGLAGLMAALRIISAEAFAFFAIAAVYNLRVAIIGFTSTNMQAAFRALIQSGQAFASSKSILLALSSILNLILGQKHALLYWSNGDACVLYPNFDIRPQQAGDINYFGAIKDSLKNYPSKLGVISTRQMSTQLKTFFLDYLEFLPSRVVFIKTTAIIDSQELEAIILIPLGAIRHLISERRILEQIETLSASVDLLLSSARARFLASGTLASREKSVSARELELNDLIHMANNIAQDIAIQCDTLRHKTLDLGPKTLAEFIAKIEAASRRLSTGVSDVRWLRELTRTRLSKREVFPLNPIMDDLEIFLKDFSLRKNFDAELKFQAPSDRAVRLASREFFESAFRMAVREVVKTLGTPLKIIADVRARGNVIECNLHMQSENSVSLMKAAEVLKSGEDSFADNGVASALLALNKVVSFEGEKLSLSSKDDFSSTALLSFRLSMEALASQPGIGAGQWVLLVDDSPEVLTFYSRISEALGIRYGTADSLPAAKELVDKMGKPRLVITDVHLGETSGLDLLKILRAEYGEKLPVIVVSGETDADLADKVRALGASKFLSKPVGRRKLFAEIQSLLSSDS